MGKAKRLVIYPIGEKRHSLYNDTIEFLKKNYNLVYIPNDYLEVRGKISLLKDSLILKKIYYKFLRQFMRLFKNDKKTLSDEYKDDLILCHNSLPPEGFDFIVDFEIISALSGYDYDGLNKEYIKKRFEHDSCKAIIAWNHIAYRSLVETIDCRKFIDKIKIIPFSIKSHKKKMKNDKKITNLLFVSSLNNPQDFEIKGGVYTLEVFSRLIKKNEEVHLTLRSSVPAWLKKKYSYLKNVTFLEEPLSSKDFQRLLNNSNILLEPLPGINLLLECMSFGIPSISFDFWAIPEMVINKKTGFIVDSSSLFGKREEIEKYMRYMKINSLKLFAKNPDEILVENLLEKVEELIENKMLRNRMVINSLNLVKSNGIYGSNKREKALSRVIDSNIN